MLKLAHDGEIIDISMKGDFSDLLTEFTETTVTFIEILAENYDIDKVEIAKYIAEATDILCDMPNMYHKEEEDSIFN